MKTEDENIAAAKQDVAEGVLRFIIMAAESFERVTHARNRLRAAETDAARHIRSPRRYAAKKPSGAQPTGVDATAERIAKEPLSAAGTPLSEIVEVPIGSAEERQGRARRFASTHLDRLHKAGRIDLRNHKAGEWYRDTHQRCRFESAIVAAYGERIGGGWQGGGLARTEAQAEARRSWRSARQAIPARLRGFMDRFLLHDAMPRYGGRKAMRMIAETNEALASIADWLNLPGRGDASLASMPPAAAAKKPTEIERAPVPDCDPRFLNDRGFMRPGWAIAKVLRGEELDAEEEAA